MCMNTEKSRGCGHGTEPSGQPGGGSGLLPLSPATAVAQTPAGIQVDLICCSLSGLSSFMLGLHSWGISSDRRALFFPAWFSAVSQSQPSTSTRVLAHQPGITSQPSPGLERRNAARPFRDQRFRLCWERGRKQPEQPKTSRAWRGRKNGDSAGSFTGYLSYLQHWVSGRRAWREDSAAERSIPKSNYV